MPVVEELKRIVEKLTGIGRPARRELGRLARPPAPQLFRFRDDGETPNNPLRGIHPCLGLRLRQPMWAKARLNQAQIIFSGTAGRACSLSHWAPPIRTMIDR
ncbi:MAG: hypothetical protein ISP45_17420 [Reyranella sp.]|nr:hypothetical protein [Reyranella sp.]